MLCPELHKVPVLRTLYGGQHDQTEIRPFSFSAIGTKLRPQSHHRPPHTADTAPNMADTAPNTADTAPNTADTAPNTAAQIVGLMHGRTRIKAAIYGGKTSNLPQIRTCCSHFMAVLKFWWKSSNYGRIYIYNFYISQDAQNDVNNQHQHQKQFIWVLTECIRIGITRIHVRQ